MRTIQLSLACLTIGSTIGSTIVAAQPPTTPTGPTGPSVPSPTGPATPVPAPQPLPGPYDPVDPTGPLAPEPTTEEPVDPQSPTTDPTIPDTTGADPNAPLDPSVPTSPYPSPTPTNLPSTPTPDPYGDPVIEERHAGWSYGSLTDLGVSIFAGAGVGGFTNDAMRGSTRDGGGWDVRVGIGTRRTLGLEIGYLGSAQQVDALGLDDDALLISNGAQANLRLNFLPRMRVTPFAFGGAAFRRYDLTNSATNTSDLTDSDTVFEVPMGFGLGARAGGVLLEARGEYRAAFDEDLVGADAPMNRYGATLNVGYAF